MEVDFSSVEVDIDSKHGESAEKYRRGHSLGARQLRKIGNNKLRNDLVRQERKFQQVALLDAQSEILVPNERTGIELEDDLVQTWQLRQKEILEHVDSNTLSKKLDLSLELGEYNIDFTRSGRHMLIGGRKGHIAMMDWKEKKLLCEIQVQQTIRDVKFLQNQSMFAIAQKNSVYIYDQTGLELHCLRKHVDPNRLEFLPYHYLLASVGRPGVLRYQDTSTGELISECKAKLGPVDCMRQNPKNAIIHLGHERGFVTLWTPNMGTAAVKLLAHRGPILSMAIEPNEGRCMMTSGADGTVKLWDIRTYKQLKTFFTKTPGTTIDISTNGLVALGGGAHVQLWNKDILLTGDQVTTKPSMYLKDIFPSEHVRDVQFIPFEDFLGVGRTGGVSTLVIPGAADTDYDALEVNPFETKSQIREREVKGLLEKLRPEMIQLSGDFIGKVDRTDPKIIAKEREEEDAKIKEKGATSLKEKNRARGKNRTSRRLLRKKLNSNVIDKKKLDFFEKKEKAKKMQDAAKEAELRRSQGQSKSALNRFMVS